MSPRSRKRRAAGASRVKVGLPPGTPVYTGDAVDVPVNAAIIDYDAQTLDEQAHAPWEVVRRHRDTATATWIDIVGLHDTEALHKVTQHFKVHPLMLEDLLSVHGRPKVEEFGAQLLVILRMAVGEADAVRLEHVGLVLGGSWVLSFQERPGDVFEPVRRRLRTSSGRIRRMGADYLLHALLDAVIDGYFVAMEHYDEQIEAIEEGVLRGSSPRPPQRLHAIGLDLAAMQRAILPLRQQFGRLGHEEGHAISAEVRPYFRDLADHCAQVLDLLEAARERTSGILQLHLATTNNRMSEVMRLLTVVSTIFIPLTFVAGIYGMNFDHMPELHWRGGYPAVLALMALVAGVMIGWMRREML